MSPNETKALAALANAYSDYEDFCFLSFAAIAANSGLDPKLVRRTVRSLARKGLMTIFDFMGNHPILTFFLAYFAMYAVVGVAAALRS